MRIFVLTANHELRVSRKSHLRDHSNTGTRHGRDNDGAGADYADDDDGGADYANDDDGGADYADDDGGADYADDEGEDYTADALTHAELPLDRVTGLSGVKSLQKVDRLTPIKSLKHIKRMMPLKSVQVNRRGRRRIRERKRALRSFLYFLFKRRPGFNY
jgi:hypothetical protein